MRWQGRRESNNVEPPPQPVSQQQSTRSISPNDDEAAKFTSVILATTEDTWGQLFQKMGRGYQQPKLMM